MLFISRNWKYFRSGPWQYLKIEEKANLQSSRRILKPSLPCQVWHTLYSSTDGSLISKRRRIVRVPFNFLINSLKVPSLLGWVSDFTMSNFCLIKSSIALRNKILYCCVQAGKFVMNDTGGMTLPCNTISYDTLVISPLKPSPNSLSLRNFCPGGSRRPALMKKELLKGEESKSLSLCVDSNFRFVSAKMLNPSFQKGLSTLDARMSILWSPSCSSSGMPGQPCILYVSLTNLPNDPCCPQPSWTS